MTFDLPKVFVPLYHFYLKGNSIENDCNAKKFGLIPTIQLPIGTTI